MQVPRNRESSTARNTSNLLKLEFISGRLKILTLKCSLEIKMINSPENLYGTNVAEDSKTTNNRNSNSLNTEDKERNERIMVKLFTRCTIIIFHLGSL